MIDARGLHGWLGIGRDFPTWIKKVFEDYGFQAGEDYSPVLGNRSGHAKGRGRIDYLLTPSVGKEVAMIGNTKIGRQTRQYFIRMEQAALQN